VEFDLVLPGGDLRSGHRGVDVLVGGRLALDPGVLALHGYGAPSLLRHDIGVGLFVFLPFPGRAKLVSSITSATVLSFGTGSARAGRAAPGAPRAGAAVPRAGRRRDPFLAFYASNLIVYWAGWETNWKLSVAVLIGYVVPVVFQRLRKDRVRRWNGGARSWLVPWLSGLAVHSLLRLRGRARRDPVRRSFVVILGFRLGIYALAVRLLMVPERVVDSVRSTPGDEPDGLKA